MSACEKCGEVLEEYECSRTDERLTVPHRPSQCLANLTAQRDRLAARLAEVERERDEAREGYHRLDDNWATLHNAGMNALRVALHMPDATVPEMVERIAAISATGGKETK